MSSAETVVTIRMDKNLFDTLARNALGKYGMEDWQPDLLQLSENITYLLQKKSTGEKAILRISRPGYHTVDELESELKWIEQIKKDTPIIVASPIKGLDGEYIQFLKDDSKKAYALYTCILFEYMEGSSPDESDEDNIIKRFFNLGEISACLHRHSKTWKEANTLHRFVWDHHNMIGNNPKWGFWQNAPDLDIHKINFLEKAQMLIRKRLKAYGRNSRNFGLIHADLRLANLLIDGDKLKVIDFDDCGYGWYLHDLASAISFIETKPITKKMIVNWIAGYQKISVLTQEDLDEINTFIMQRRLQLLGWLTSHSESTPAKALSVGFTDGTIALAEEYLRNNS
jgi:Ser/Thr protein kinase RdoA (MazF antagonist)